MANVRARGSWCQKECLPSRLVLRAWLLCDFATNRYAQCGINKPTRSILAAGRACDSIGSQAQKPLALVVVGGMLTAAVLILVVLPVLYEIVHHRSANIGEGEMG